MYVCILSIQRHCEIIFHSIQYFFWCKFEKFLSKLFSLFPLVYPENYNRCSVSLSTNKCRRMTHHWKVHFPCKKNDVFLLKISVNNKTCITLMHNINAWDQKKKEKKTFRAKWYAIFIVTSGDISVNHTSSKYCVDDSGNYTIRIQHQLESYMTNPFARKEYWMCRKVHSDKASLLFLEKTSFAHIYHSSTKDLMN